MFKLILISFFLFISCNTITQKHNKKKNKPEKRTIYNIDTLQAPKIDTLYLSMTDTLFDNLRYPDIYTISDEYKITPTKKIVLGDINYYSEGFIYKKDTIIIQQLIKVNKGIYKKDSFRKIFINGKLAHIKRILIKNAKIFNNRNAKKYNFFNNILLDYYYFQKLYYRKSNYILIEQPMGWCGSNKNEFVLVINPKDNEVLEFFTEYDQSCL